RTIRDRQFCDASGNIFTTGFCGVDIPNSLVLPAICVRRNTVGKLFSRRRWNKGGDLICVHTNYLSSKNLLPTKPLRQHRPPRSSRSGWRHTSPTAKIGGVRKRIKQTCK